ncbi:MAG: hypothetical protein IZT59_05385 [Verrucomicrobia bacterium]|nr:hypothetical protein [Verrucomicrobiota bacterium]
MTRRSNDAPTVPDERNVFLLSLKAGGSGLKCTFAVMFLLVINILGHNRKLGFGNGEEAPDIRWFFRLGRKPVGVDGFFGAVVPG